jgi:hypothetical protein
MKGINVLSVKNSQFAYFVLTFYITTSGSTSGKDARGARGSLRRTRTIASQETNISLFSPSYAKN